MHNNNSKFYFPKDYILIDLETTGFSHLKDDIIEVAFIKMHDGKEIARLQTLTQPTYHIKPLITNITGITNDMLMTAPKFSKIGRAHV